jgi:hypothetical protein
MAIANSIVFQTMKHPLCSMNDSSKPIYRKSEIMPWLQSLAAEAEQELSMACQLRQRAEQLKATAEQMIAVAEYLEKR